RIALAAMFLLTASAHWGKRRPDLIRMVPAAFPRPELLVTITGACEIAGACGLIIPEFAPLAATALVLLLIAIFPANVRAAREGIAFAGRPPTPLAARAAIQVIFLSVMLLTEPFFRSFTRHEICNTASHTEGLFALSCGTRAEVDEMVRTAVA